MDRDPNTSLASANNEDIPANNENTSGEKFVDHIVTHFHADNCPSFCSRLWSVDYLMIKCIGMELLLLQEILFRPQIILGNFQVCS